MSSSDKSKKTTGKRHWESMATVWAGVGEKRRRGLRILPKEGGYFVHVTSRTHYQQFLFGEEEKRVFVGMMRKWADFSGLSVITYCMMDNHFHVMLWVPGKVSLDHAEILESLKGVWPEEKVLAWELFYATQREEVQGSMNSAVLARMGDLSEFMRVLKQSFTCWFNARHGLKGPLWDARYRSVVVEGSPLALMSVAAYIDLNPLRAGMVEDPQAYGFSGYGAAMMGNQRARKGLEQLVKLARGHQPDAALKVRRKQLSSEYPKGQRIAPQLAKEMSQRASPQNWQEVQAAYRIWLVNKGASLSDVAQVHQKFRQRKGWDPVQVIAEYEKHAASPFSDKFNYKMRSFSRGVAIGAPEFLEGLMHQFRSCFGASRPSAARRVKGIGQGWMSLRQVD
ncbi:transposase [Kiritimatiellota bacterium B12222]|nr:transposase [Kiritimatiellota bacterium B12222]